MFSVGFEKTAALLPKTLASAKRAITSKPAMMGAAGGAVGGAVTGAMSKDEYGQGGGVGGALKGALLGGTAGALGGAAAKKGMAIRRAKAMSGARVANRYGMATN